MNKELKEFLDNTIIFTHNNKSDGSTLINLLRYMDGNKLLVDEYKQLGELCRPDLFVDLCKVVHDNSDIYELSDDELNSMIDGELYDYMSNKYVEIFYEANLNIITKYVDHWESTKTLLDCAKVNGGEIDEDTE